MALYRHHFPPSLFTPYLYTYMDNNKMKVEVWSDIMCPFCYIGKRHYEQALERFAHRDKIELEWKSFQLDPTIPEHMDAEQNVYQYLAGRKGISYEQSVKMHEQVVKMAADAGLDYHFDKAVVANSFRAHRIIQLAKTKGLGDVAEECFFRAYFMEGRNLGNEQDLVDIGSSIGLTAEEVHNALADDVYAYNVTQDVQEAQTIGVRGVPFFVVDRKYAVSGAQPVDVFLGTLEQAYGERKG